MNSNRRHKRSDTTETLSPAQKAIIDAHLAEALEDIKHGRLSQPFHTVEDLARALRNDLKAGAKRRAERDQGLAEGWFSLDEEAAQQRHT